MLIDALGLKLGDRETQDILDIFNTHPDTVRRRSWHDPDREAPDFDAMSDDALTRHARDWDALSLYGWEPYMYNPRLKRRYAIKEITQLIVLGNVHWSADIVFNQSNFFARLDEISTKLKTLCMEFQKQFSL